jgi:hypothetical protein
LTDNDQVIFAGRIEGRRGRRDDFQAIKPAGLIREDEIPLHRLVSDFGRYGLLPSADEIFRAFAPAWGSRVTLDPEVSPVRRKNLTVSFRGLIEVGRQSEPITLLGAQIGVEISGLKMILVERGTSVGYDEVYPMPAFERTHGKDFRDDANAFFDALAEHLAWL